MNITLVMFAGLIVAILIIAWAVLEVTRRYMRQKKTEARAWNAWVMVKPTTTVIVDETSPKRDNQGAEDIDESDLHKRSKQNGHYSQSKKPL